ncbi:MAG TPA: hypothetical protein VK919_11210, partial [Solirubrobacterales bacterium]|nr:hypothetical protein [Solirubrobacterales bacterium]
MRGRRMLLFAALALLVPLPALAVNRYEAAAGGNAEGFGVSVALDRCALLEARILCKLDVSYAPVADATSYVASVTGPDGSVVDGGGLGSGGGSIWVAYTGDGTYTVEVSAFGEPDEPGGEAKL